MEEFPGSEYKIASHEYKNIPRNVTKNVDVESALQISGIRMIPYYIRTRNLHFPL
jgi:hypothetical protein